MFSPTSPSPRSVCGALALFLLFVSSALSVSLLCHWLHSFASSSFCLSLFVPPLRGVSLPFFFFFFFCFSKAREGETKIAATEEEREATQDKQGECRRKKKKSGGVFESELGIKQSDGEPASEEEAVRACMIPACSEQDTAGLCRRPSGPGERGKGSQP